MIHTAATRLRRGAAAARLSRDAGRAQAEGPWRLTRGGVAARGASYFAAAARSTGCTVRRPALRQVRLACGSAWFSPCSGRGGIWAGSGCAGRGRCSALRGKHCAAGAGRARCP